MWGEIGGCGKVWRGVGGGEVNVGRGVGGMWGSLLGCAVVFLKT